MLLISLQLAQDAPTGVFGVPIGFALPVTVIAILVVAIVFMFYLTIRDTAPGARADAMKAFAALVRALGEVVRVALEAVAKMLR